ncbi:MAG: SUMF1/EgtB/PvdO family nonheme iron enzyme, partial [Magnetospirillum sp.]|nr:SUMF1/EgtB/PvdO family nonheme iron enzyme [Magnetospirillum sp.]
SGRRCRLPTEAEWEAAARAGTSTAYWWGDEVGRGHANCRDCLGGPPPYGTAPVASFPPNPYGLADMNGNLWEWTADCFVDRSPGRHPPPPPGGGCAQRVIKGGAWYYYAPMATAAARAGNDVRISSYTIGIRPVCE